jgi:tRNA uridine 5-carboxymethylaminomethyl modification enzyme
MDFQIIVVGAGHAGIEASLAAARLGLRTACVTMRLDRIGHLPCNCSIGGPAKGHMAREVDALGGQMGVATDLALTHIRRVGTGKGPAIQTVRAHVCKDLYPRLMRETLEREPNLTLIEGTVESLIWRGTKILGVKVRGTQQTEATELRSSAVVLTTGTFLNGLCHEGKRKTVAARFGDQAATTLTDSLLELGIRIRRFKTGTTPRIRLGSIDFSEVEEMPSDLEAGAVSFLHDRPMPRHELLPAWQTRTNAATHAIIRDNLGESAMYGGQIEGTGPRYCPSIEDKVVRFADKDSHPIFFERETWEGEEVYVQGVSTSLPAEIQIEILRTIPGLRDVEMLRPGYAVEYDMADPLQLTPHLMSKQAEGLFLAGQLNGTSGYEEAAGQGLVAGINAARLALGEAPVDFARDNSFIGVMVDDLVTKGVDDPYRMLTARAEHRLLLRHDNADQRLTPIAREIGLCSDERWARFEDKMARVQAGMDCLESTQVSSFDNPTLARLGIAPVSDRITLFDLMKRPEVDLDTAALVAESCNRAIQIPVDREVREQVELNAMYDGYIKRQSRLADQARRLDSMRIPAGFEYGSLNGLSFESREKLERVRPLTVGQASRIPGVRPTDVALLIGHLKVRRAVATNGPA